MSNITFSRSAAMSIIQDTRTCQEEISTNIQMMEKNVNSNFELIKDPSILRYLQMQEMVNRNFEIVFQEMDQIIDYCNYIISWIDAYNDSHPQ